jgi:hypothetical protein
VKIDLRSFFQREKLSLEKKNEERAHSKLKKGEKVLPGERSLVDAATPERSLTQGS